MKKVTMLSCVVVVCALLGLASSAGAAASGTAWGYQVGTPACATYNPGTAHSEYRCFLTLSYPGGPDTIVVCRPPYASWCAAITSGKTVILSFDDQTLLFNNDMDSYLQKVTNGTTLTAY